MKKVLMLAILISFFTSGIVFAGDSALGETALEKAFKDGKFKGKIGFYAEGKDPDVGQSGNLVTSFAELGFLSGSLSGLQFGVTLFGVTDLDDDVNLQFKPDHNVDNHTGGIKELYAKYTIPGTKSSLMMGRADMDDSCPTVDGDTHEGVMFTSKDMENVTINAAVITSYIDDFDPDEDGVESRTELGQDFSQEAGDYVFTATADIALGIVEFAPYVGIHPDNDHVYGILFDTSYKVNDKLKLGLEGNYGVFGEDTPATVSSTDEDWTQYIISPNVEYGPVKLAVGYVKASDDNNVKADGGKSMLIKSFSPMEKLSDSDVQDYSHKFGSITVGIGPVELGLLYGEQCDDLNNGADDADEMDYTIAFNITKNLSLEAIYADVSYDQTPAKDYTYYDASLVYKFSK